MNKEVKKYMAQLGKKGGKTTGESKVRGDADYYRSIAEKGRKKKRGKK